MEACVMKSTSSKTFTPGPTPNTVRAADGRVLTAPDGWILMPPGDAALTRRVKAAGDHWIVAAKKKEADARRRDKAQAEYVEDFFGAVVKFLGFHPNYAVLAQQMAKAVTEH